MNDEFSISQQRLIKVLTDILPDHKNYIQPVIRADGDIVIPLEPSLKKSRESHRRLAETFRSMMDADVPEKPKSRAWVK